MPGSSSLLETERTALQVFPIISAYLVGGVAPVLEIAILLWFEYVMVNTTSLSKPHKHQIID